MDVSHAFQYCIQAGRPNIQAVNVKGTVKQTLSAADGKFLQVPGTFARGQVIRFMNWRLGKIEILGRPRKKGGQA